MQKPSLSERIAENSMVPVAVGAAALALSTADPTFGPLVGGVFGIIANSVGAMSFQTRLKDTVHRIYDDLQSLKDQVAAMSSAQFKLTSETFQTLLRTSEQEKLEYLRNVIRGTVLQADLEDIDASILSRIIRDISAPEIRLLIESSKFDVICAEPDGEGKFIVDTTSTNPFEAATKFRVTDTAQRMLLSGLIGLGLILRSNVLAEFYDFTPAARRLAKLLEDAKST